MKIKKNCFLLSVLLLLGLLAKAQCTNSDILTTRGNAQTEFLACVDTNYDFDDITDIVELICEQDTDGFWAGIDYCETDDNDWMEHLKNLTQLSEVFADGLTFCRVGCNTQVQIETDCSISPQPINITQDDLTDAILNGLTFWYDFDSNNSCPTSADDCAAECGTALPCNGEENAGWWDNWIGKQRELQQISMYFYPVLSQTANSDLLERIINDLPESIRDCDSNRNFTGANLTDVAGSMITRGILACDPDLIEDGVQAIESAIDFADYPQQEGIQLDYSIHQHNALIYNGGYGMSFLEASSKWGAIVDDHFPFSDPKSKDRLVQYVLQGTRMMTVGNNTDYSANGRYLTRKYPNNNAAVPLKVMDWLIGFGTGGSGQLTTMRNKIASQTPQLQYVQDEVDGNYYFWKSDYVTYHQPNYFSSLKMCSPRTIGIESVSGQNARGYWLPYGCTFIYKDGTEYIREIGTSGDYESIFPFWDWNFVPGVTNPVLSNNDLLPGDNDDLDEINTQSNSFVGNASNGTYAVSTMDLNKVHPNGTLTAKKSWFHFGDEIIALGADISDASAHTTINQCLSAGTVAYQGGTLAQNDNAVTPATKFHYS